VSKSPQIGLILLAAGASARMGTPKQLLRIEGELLIRRAIQMAVKASCRPVVVVLGAHEGMIRPEIAHLPITIAINSTWQDGGMSSSIQCGLKALLAEVPDAGATILMPCDQPRVTNLSIRKLISVYQSTSSGIVGAQYESQIGTPALFSHKYFEELQSLSGPSGAKSLLKKYSSHVVAVDLPEASLDLDTIEDIGRISGV